MRILSDFYAPHNFFFPPTVPLSFPLLALTNTSYLLSPNCSSSISYLLLYFLPPLSPTHSNFDDQFGFCALSLAITPLWASSQPWSKHRPVIQSEMRVLPLTLKQHLAVVSVRKQGALFSTNEEDCICWGWKGDWRGVGYSSQPRGSSLLKQCP